MNDYGQENFLQSEQPSYLQQTSRLDDISWLINLFFIAYQPFVGYLKSENIFRF